MNIYLSFLYKYGELSAVYQQVIFNIYFDVQQFNLKIANNRKNSRSQLCTVQMYNVFQFIFIYFN